MSPRCGSKSTKTWNLHTRLTLIHTYSEHYDTARLPDVHKDSGCRQKTYFPVHMNNKQSQTILLFIFYVFCDMKVLYILFGTLSLALGIIGIFLPLLPTTPFLLLTAALYVRSSPRLYNRLLHHKYLGSYIRNFRENKAIPLRAKIISVSLIWITILNCIFS